MGKFKINILSSLLIFVFWIETKLVRIKVVNYPKNSQFIIALWHAHQCVLYSIKNKKRLNVLISPSNDGEIISRATESVGIKTIRGSHNRKGTAATLQLIEKLEQGESIAMTVDGPRGPNRKVKKGIINIGKLTQVPIVPVTWYSNSKFFIKFPSWDGFRFPLFKIDTIALYGDPIYIPADASEEQLEQYREKVEISMKNLEKRLEDNYKDYEKIAK